MILMVGDHNSSAIHYWAGKYGRMGRLLGPNSFNTSKVKPWLHWAMDNDAFVAYTNKQPWDECKWRKMLGEASGLKHKPMWALVPDVVGDRAATIEKWHRYYPVVEEAGVPAAFAAQDGMTPDDVPRDATVVFVGGTTDFKWKNVGVFCREFPRVHVGRVNTIDRCYLCQDLGVESVDGTGWFRDGTGDWRFKQIEDFFEGKRQPELQLN